MQLEHLYSQIQNVPEFKTSKFWIFRLEGSTNTQVQNPRDFLPQAFWIRDVALRSKLFTAISLVTAKPVDWLNESCLTQALGSHEKREEPLGRRGIWMRHRSKYGVKRGRDNCRYRPTHSLPSQPMCTNGECAWRQNLWRSQLGYTRSTTSPRLPQLRAGLLVRLSLIISLASQNITPRFAKLCCLALTAGGFLNTHIYLLIHTLASIRTKQEGPITAHQTASGSCARRTSSKEGHRDLTDCPCIFFQFFQITYGLK